MDSVGVIGLGNMGSAVAANLCRSGTRVVGFDLDPRARDRASASGVDVLESAAAVAAQARVILTSLPSEEALVAVGLELAEAMVADQILVEMSTLPVDRKRALAQALPPGAAMLDCTLSGTGTQAKAGDLVVFGSGDPVKYESVLPILKLFSRRQMFLGEFGNGLRMKWVANLLVTVHNVSTAEAFLFAQRAGLDLQTVYEALYDSAGSSRMLQIRGPLMVTGDYENPTARMGSTAKTLKMIAQVAAEVRCPTPLFDASVQAYQQALAQGMQELDPAAVFAAISKN